MGLFELVFEFALGSLVEVTESGSRNKYLILGILRAIIGFLLLMISCILIITNERLISLILSVPLFIYSCYLIFIVNLKSYKYYKNNNLSGIVKKPKYYRYD